MIVGDVPAATVGIPLIRLGSAQLVARFGVIRSVCLLLVCNGPSTMIGTTMMSLSVWKSLK